MVDIVPAPLNVSVTLASKVSVALLYKMEETVLHLLNVLVRFHASTEFAVRLSQEVETVFIQTNVSIMRSASTEFVEIQSLLVVTACFPTNVILV